MTEKMSRRDVLDKCIVVFEAIRRAASKGNAGLEPAKGAEDSFRMDSEILDTLREMVRELEAGERKREEADWQKEIEKYGPPRMLFEIGQLPEEMEDGSLEEMRLI